MSIDRIEENDTVGKTFIGTQDVIKENLLYCMSGNNTIDMVYHNKIRTFYPIHTHAEHYVVGIVIVGKIQIETYTDKYVCKSGGIFVIPTDAAHSIKPVDNCFYTMLSLCIYKDYFLQTKMKDIQSMVDRKLKQIFHEDALTAAYSEMLAEGLMILGASQLKDFTEESYSDKLKHRLIEMPELNFSIEDMSREICVSSFHMIRCFKKEFGLTPHQFQIQCRIRKAQKMLLSNATVAEVALDTGFYDQSHFVRCFKRLIGISPALYKKVAILSKEQE